MKRLFLLRHAKAGFGTSDVNRPLANRGGKDALWLGEYLKKSDLMPDHILCSSAVRAQETRSQLLEGAQSEIATIFHDDLYLAPAEQMARKLHSLKNTITAAMIIGHNPGISLLFQMLAHNPPQEQLYLKYPTCMVTILDFNVQDWADLKSNMGQLFDLIVPHDRQESNPGA
ncbi:MAG: hypothetical protein KAI89_11030 [Emcibacter sp.]|nr:hypothetical protein [Emcibacter sp.]